MKIRFIAMGAIAMAIAAPAFAGAINGADIATAKYSSTKCKAPDNPGLLISAIKSRKAFTNAATAHNEFTAAISDYQKCRVEELNADQNAMVEQTKAELEALVKVSNDEGAALQEKQKEIK